MAKAKFYTTEYVIARIQYKFLLTLILAIYQWKSFGQEYYKKKRPYEAYAYHYIYPVSSWMREKAKELFGSWGGAISATGLDYTAIKKEIISAVPNKGRTKTYTAKGVISHIRRKFLLTLILAAYQWKTFGWEYYDQESSNGAYVAHYIAPYGNTYLYAKAKEFFGSWENAVIAAGLNYAEIEREIVGRIWSKEFAVALVQWKYMMMFIANVCQWKTFGWQYCNINILNAGHVSVHDHQHFRKSLKYFGSWENLVAKANLEYKLIRMTEEWDKPKITSSLVDLDKQGKSLNPGYVSIAHPKVYSAARRHHEDGYYGAVEAAGFDYADVCIRVATKTRLRKLTTEKLQMIRERFVDKS